MYKRIISILGVFAFVLSMGEAASARRHSHPPAQGVTLSSDTDCWVEIDKKIVGYVQKDQKVVFPVSPGNHAIAAANRDGDLWEQQVNIINRPGQVVVISFRKQHSDRALLENDVADLQRRVGQKETELAQIRDQSPAPRYTPEVAATERKQILNAIDVYASHYGTQLGLRDSRNQESQQVSDAAQQQYLENYFQHYGNTTVQATDLAVYGFGLLWAHHLKAKAHRNQLAVQAASLRMEQLGDLLQNPTSPLRASVQPDYLTMQRDVLRKKAHGRLVTASGWLEYSDSSGVLRLSCSDVKKVKGEKQLGVEYVSMAGGKKKTRSLKLTAARKSERSLLLGDVYLACPALTE